MKKLQVTLDLFNTEDAKKMLEKVGDYVDIIELGTPLTASKGADVIREIKLLYPEKTVSADIKITDGDSIMVGIAFQAGADMVSILVQTNDTTIQNAIKTAEKYHGEVLVDTRAVKDTEARAKQIEPWELDYVCVHIGYDVQNTGANPAEEVKRLSAMKCEEVAASGIKMVTFEAVCQGDIDDITIGGGLFNAPDPAVTVKQMYEILDKYR